jgi:hypothetical protein
MLESEECQYLEQRRFFCAVLFPAFDLVFFFAVTMRS